MGCLAVFSEREFFRLVFFRSVQEAESLAVFFGMLGVMNVVGVDHALQVFTAVGRAPLEALMDDDVVENEVEQSVAKDAEGNGKQVRIGRGG